MMRVISISGDGAGRIFTGALLGAALLLIVATGARGAQVIPGDLSSGDRRDPVERGGADRVVVEPGPDWSGWNDWNDSCRDGRLRVQAWVDRGDWATYSPGDLMWVYFRVNRPCHVTIIDYAPDGGVDVVYPNRWSGSRLVHPGRVYRVPESRMFSLRIAGSGGVETLVVCAHEAPWPSGPGGMWLPPHHPRGGRVAVGGDRRRPPPRGRGIVVLPGDASWNAPPAWHEHTGGWSCDYVTFRVSSDHGWHDGTHFQDTFTMRRPADRFCEDVCIQGESGSLRIECTESSHGDPTEIAGHFSWGGGWGSMPLFRIDVDGRHGERPHRGTTFVEHAGPARIEVEILDLEIEHASRWRPERIDWIRFGIRVTTD